MATKPARRGMKAPCQYTMLRHVRVERTAEIEQWPLRCTMARGWSRIVCSRVAR